jgi:rhomboid protease GluP
MWGFAGPLRVLFRSWSFTNVVTAVCVVLFVATLVLDPSAAIRPRGYFDVFAPSNGALQAFGAAGAIPWRYGYWWTIFTAIYLHGGLLHILFNLLWIRQLGPAVEEIYGPARLVIIFTVAGAVGFVASNMFGVWFTVGASGSIFGLLGAIIAYARKRGGAFGRLVLQQYGQWALILFIAGFLLSGVNNFAHAGGFVGGYAAGLGLSLAERRAESTLDWLLAAAAIVVTAVGFALALFTAFSR